MSRSSLALALPIALAISATTAAAQAQSGTNGDRFNWSGKVPAGAWIMVRSVMGPISVKAASGQTAEITGIKRPERGGDPGYVHFTSKPLANGGILVCAFWTENATCSISMNGTRTVAPSDAASCAFAAGSSAWK